MVDSANKIANYSFIKTAKLLKCDPEVEAQKLHKQHYSQVLSALNEFTTETLKSIIDQTQNKTLSTTELKAVNFLKTKFPNISQQEKEQLTQAIHQIKNKRFQNLTKEINKLANNTKNKGLKPSIVLEALLNIIQKYDVNSHVEVELAKENTTQQDIKPTIVVSQSYN
jgi:glutamyl-tRNA reductase